MSLNLGAKGDTGDPEIPGDHGIRGPRGLIGKVTLHGYKMQSHICLQQLATTYIIRHSVIKLLTHQCIGSYYPHMYMDTLVIICYRM